MKQFRDTNYYVEKDGGIWNKRNKKLKTRVNKYGYEDIGLWIEKKKICFLVHRLVAECYLDSWKSTLTVNHKDFNKLNNHVDNLEMLTIVDNLNHFKKENPGFYFSQINKSRKGKTYEEIYGLEKAKKLREKRRQEGLKNKNIIKWL